ncbi:hypothetical protein [Methylovulum miyakonense]|nr:hypothetical protein [Methylovulum miyakonense]
MMMHLPDEWLLKPADFAGFSQGVFGYKSPRNGSLTEAKAS